MSTYEILNEEGEAVNRIVADQTFVETVYPGRYRLVETPRHVPEAVSRAQGKYMLIQMGLWHQVLGFVDSIEDPTEQALADVALTDTQEWRRDSPFLNQCAQALGLTDEMLDDLFISADLVQL